MVCYSIGNSKIMCLPLFHKYKVVRAEQAYGKYFGYPLTVLYSICEKCNKTKIETVEGHFGIKDFEKRG